MMETCGYCVVVTAEVGNNAMILNQFVPDEDNTYQAFHSATAAAFREMDDHWVDCKIIRVEVTRVEKRNP